MFRKYTASHNQGIHIGSIKSSECRMVGEHIALCRILRLKGALQSLISSQEFQDMNQFEEEVWVLQSEDFWKILFTMCRSLYSPMRVLHLADQKIPAMDKLHFYACQTDSYLSKHLKEAMLDSALLQDQKLLNLMDVVSFDVVELNALDDQNEVNDDKSSGDNKDYVDEDDGMSVNKDNNDDDDNDVTEDHAFTNDADTNSRGFLHLIIKRSALTISMNRELLRTISALVSW